LALAAPAGGTNEISFSADSPEIAAYLRGETISHSAARGWCRIAVDGFPLGWGKADGHLIKNRYPRGLRRRV
jgi:NOL1/NOP2/fmu family ribosome biogenesis protein